MTAHWEATLTQISEKSCRYQDFMQPLEGTLQELIYQAKQSRASLAFRGLPPPASAGGKNAKSAAKARGKANELPDAVGDRRRWHAVFLNGRGTPRRRRRGAAGRAGDLGRSEEYGGTCAMPALLYISRSELFGRGAAEG